MTAATGTGHWASPAWVAPPLKQHHALTKLGIRDLPALLRLRPRAALPAPLHALGQLVGAARRQAQQLHLVLQRRAARHHRVRRQHGGPEPQLGRHAEGAPAAHRHAKQPLPEARADAGHGVATQADDDGAQHTQPAVTVHQAAACGVEHLAAVLEAAYVVQE
eukprot:CAMPEP_0202866132 /NCGR_PEP_ID=MMETSP1391-20130828/7222_1 /ASSEMBLY_ACC=CAM_ASM_000867 /TAXON_ID=1034604 /ORGANISM="Chlamydomonas leiostraca, Strain SAG 11-49" /LENGTH=162 /DNA_ID=CAMNT_0049546055 /DNA_START=122 /DNA_END=611 /DNA_ORIENTATION=+